MRVQTKRCGAVHVDLGTITTGLLLISLAGVPPAENKSPTNDRAMNTLRMMPPISALYPRADSPTLSKGWTRGARNPYAILFGFSRMPLCRGSSALLGA